jgi:hypothetical protein
MRVFSFLLSLFVLLALLSPCVYAQSVEKNNLAILPPIAEGLGLIAGIFTSFAGICLALSFCIIPIPITVPVGIILASLAAVLAAIAFVLYALDTLGAISPNMANFLNGIITPVIDFYHRIEEWAIS